MLTHTLQKSFDLNPCTCSYCTPITPPPSICYSLMM
jgi:hypothetical protein